MNKLTFEYEEGNDTDEGRQLVVSSTLVPSMQASLGFRRTAELSSIYENLIQTWIVPLSPQIPGRVRIALEKLLRDMAGQICLASHAMRIVDMGRKGEEDETAQPENIDTDAQFVLPVRRRRSSATSLDKGKGKERLDAVVSSPLPPASSEISEDAGFLPSSSAFATLPTPEPTPSLRSRSSISSLPVPGFQAGQRLQAYASLTPQPPLAPGTQTLLSHWQTGVDPATYDWEAIQQTTAVTENEKSGGDESQGQRAAKPHKKKKQKKSPGGPSSSSHHSQPTPQRPGPSLSSQHSRDLQSVEGSSSQQTDRAVTMSQVEPGKFGGRPRAKSKRIHVRAPRPAGFK